MYTAWLNIHIILRNSQNDSNKSSSPPFCVFESICRVSKMQRKSPKQNDRLIKKKKKKKTSINKFYKKQGFLVSDKFTKHGRGRSARVARH